MASRRASNSFSKVHTVGDRGRFAVAASYQDKRLQGIKSEDPEYQTCERCKRKYKDPSKQHYSDFKNKTRCFNYEDSSN